MPGVLRGIAPVIAAAAVAIHHCMSPAYDH